MSLDTKRASRLVEARLGREPQDALEAAVVLEAWAGVPAQRALETARTLMPEVAARPLVSRAVPAIAQRPRGLALEGAAFLVTVLAIALWAEPLGDALGAGTVGRALQVALPLTLMLQWALVARHLGRPSGLAGLTRRRGALAAAGLALVAGARLLFGDAGTLAALLTVTWIAGSLLIRRGWAGVYCATVAGTVPALQLGAPALPIVAAAAVLTAAIAAFALQTTHVDGVVPGRWSRSVGAGLTGLGIGVLLVADPGVGWAVGAAPALALLPSAAGAFWAGHHLWRLAGAFAQGLNGVPACGPADPTAGEPLRILVGGILRFVLPTVAGSAALLLITAAPAATLAAFGIAALATMLVGLLSALGRPELAALGVAAGVAGELALREFYVPFAGAALCTGGLVAVTVLLPATLVLLARPARTLATTLWIA